MTFSIRDRRLAGSTFEAPSLSVVLPAFNETHRLPETLSTLRPYLAANFGQYEVIVVDDGSTDGTADMIRTLAHSWPELRVLVQPRNMGKGAAVKRGMLDASMDIVMFMDSDLATPMEEIEDFLPHFRRGVPAVVGVRTYQQDESKWRRVLGLSLQIIAHVIVFERAVVDSQCGFKVFTRDAARRIFSLVRVRGGMFDVEIFAIMHRLGIDVHYQPVHWVNKAGSRINILRCMVFDIVDMVAIRYYRTLHCYERETAVRLGHDSMRA
jgi:dolichyl-phosphate beta-glucosyltransferase